MTPAERQLVTELFDRLATLEDAQRDPDAERAIRDGLAQAPNAAYALVQTALVQDEALKRAHDRIQELEAEVASGNAPQRPGGFLDSARGSIWGRSGEPRGSVPNVRSDAPMGAPPAFGGGQPMGGPQMGGPQMGGPGYGQQGQMQPEPPPQGRGGSFLGTAAAAAAGVIGGSLLLDSIRGMTGGGRSGHGLTDSAHAAGGGGGSPWGNNAGGGGGELGRQAGLDDIGRSSGAGPSGQSQGQGAFGNAGGGGKSGESDTLDDDAEDNDDLDDNDDFDDGDDDGGGSDSDQ